MDETRRRLLTLLGTTSVAAVAGCTGGDDNGSDPATSTPSPTPTTDHLGGEPSRRWTDTASLPTPNYPAEIPLLSDPVAKLAAEGEDTDDSGEEFGVSVGLSGDASTAIIGARRQGGPNGAGAAHVFEASGDGWSPKATLTPTDGSENEGFGESVALSADATTAVIGANSGYTPGGSDIPTGRAYVFEHSGREWSQQATLTPDQEDEHPFGRSLALSDDRSTAIVTAANDADGIEPGRAYVFEQSGDGWARQAKLTSDDAAERKEFGVSVGLSGDGSTAIIGAYVDYGQEGIGPSLAYEFTDSGGGWSQRATLPRYEGGRSGGRPIALSDDASTVIMGAQGEAYVFERGGEGWIKKARLLADHAGPRDRFDPSIALSADGSTAIIGAPEDQGQAYLFERSEAGWSQQASLAAGDGDEDDRFGETVAVSDEGSTAIIGAYRDEDPNGFQAGSAYVFSLPE